MYKEYFIWLLGLVLVLAISIGYYHQRNIQQRYDEFKENQKALENIRDEVNALRVRVEEARARVERMENDPLEIEAAIRRDRRMTRDGEIIFHIEGAPEITNAPTSSPVSDGNEK